MDLNQFVAIFATFVFLAGAVRFQDCGTKSGQLESLTVTGCPADADFCVFHKNSNVSFDAQFISNVNSKNATVKVWGIIGGVPVPFALHPSDACSNWNIHCPITVGSENELKLSVPVLAKYPKISLQVRFALLDDASNKMICEQFPVKITD